MKNHKVAFNTKKILFWGVEEDLENVGVIKLYKFKF